MDAPITSPQNPRIRAVAALRTRRDREREGRILIDGSREILRALRAGLILEQIFVCEDLCRSEDCRAAVAEATRRGIERTDVGERAFEKIAFGERAEGLVAVARPPSVDLGHLRLPPDALVVVLEGVEKPGNLGAILRSADGSGADAVIVADGGTDLFNPNAIRASLGTIFAVPLASASTPDVIRWLQENDVRIAAARVDGARPYTAADLTGRVAIVLGSEAEGLGPAWSAGGIEGVRLPMHGIADSLNVSVAAAVLLYEARRQRDEQAARAAASGDTPAADRAVAAGGAAAAGRAAAAGGTAAAGPAARPRRTRGARP